MKEMTDTEAVEVFGKIDKILRDLDIEGARILYRNSGVPEIERIAREAPDYTILMSLHKARYENMHIPEPLRHQSGTWLRKRGLSRLNGMPILPEGQLPC